MRFYNSNETFGCQMTMCRVRRDGILTCSGCSTARTCTKRLSLD